MTLQGFVDVESALRKTQNRAFCALKGRYQNTANTLSSCKRKQVRDTLEKVNTHSVIIRFSLRTSERQKESIEETNTQGIPAGGLLIQVGRC